MLIPDTIICFRANLSDLRRGADRNIPTGLSRILTLKHEYEQQSDRSLLAGFQLGVCQIVKEGGEIGHGLLQFIGETTYTCAKADPQDSCDKLTTVVRILKEETLKKFQELKLKFEERVQKLEHAEGDTDNRVQELEWLKTEKALVVQQHQMRVLLCKSM